MPLLTANGTDSETLQAAVDRLGSMSLATLAADVIAKGFTGEPGADDEPPWVDPFGPGPSAYELANWLYLPRDQELDTSQPLGRALYGLVSEALQALEHASIIRSMLKFGFQGTAADAHMTYVITRYGVSVRDAGEVEQVPQWQNRLELTGRRRKLTHARPANAPPASRGTRVSGSLFDRED